MLTTFVYICEKVWSVLCSKDFPDINSHNDIILSKLKRLWSSTKEPLIRNLFLELLVGPARDLVQFLLDATDHPTVIRLVQSYGHELLVKMFYLTRTWCYTLHCERLKLLGVFQRGCSDLTQNPPFSDDLSSS